MPSYQTSAVSKYLSTASGLPKPAVGYNASGRACALVQCHSNRPVVATWGRSVRRDAQQCTLVPFTASPPLPPCRRPRHLRSGNRLLRPPLWLRRRGYSECDPCPRAVAWRRCRTEHPPSPSARVVALADFSSRVPMTAASRPVVRYPHRLRRLCTAQRPSARGWQAFARLPQSVHLCQRGGVPRHHEWRLKRRMWLLQPRLAHRSGMGCSHGHRHAKLREARSSSRCAAVAERVLCGVWLAT